MTLSKPELDRMRESVLDALLAPAVAEINEQRAKCASLVDVLTRASKGDAAAMREGVRDALRILGADPNGPARGDPMMRPDGARDLGGRSG